MTLAIVMPLAEQRGGAELILVHLLREEAAAGRRVPVAFLEDGPMADEARRLGHRVEVIEAGRLRQPLAVARTVRRLAAWLAREQPAAVVSWMQKAHVYTVAAAARARVPALWYQLELPSGRWLDRLCAVLPAAGVLCCSQAVQDLQGKLSPSLPSRVLYPTVDLARFGPDVLPPRAEARRQLGVDADRPLVVMAARLQHWKGVHVFVDAAGAVRDAVPAADFVVVGGRHDLEPGYADAVVAQAAAAGGAVRFLGHRGDVPLWMRAADVVVHASVGPEPFGMVVIEALAAGTAVVAADEAGPRESLSGGEGLLTPPGDAAALADAIAALLAEPAEARAARAERGRARAAVFAAATFPERLREACQGLLAAR